MMRKTVPEAWSFSPPLRWTVMDNMNYCRSRPAESSQPGGCSITFYYVLQLSGQGYILAQGIKHFQQNLKNFIIFCQTPSVLSLNISGCNYIFLKTVALIVFNYFKIHLCHSVFPLKIFASLDWTTERYSHSQ